MKHWSKPVRVPGWVSDPRIQVDMLQNKELLSQKIFKYFHEMMGLKHCPNQTY